MKLFKLFLLTSLISTAVSCDKDGDNQSGSNCTTEVTFSADNLVLTLPVAGLNTENKALFQLKDPSPFDAEKVSRILAIRLQSSGITDITVLDLVLEFNVEDATSCIPTGIYNMNDLDFNDGIMSFAYSTGFGSFYFAGLNDGEAIINITECDFENKMVSGTFNGTVINGLNGDSILISNGTFDNVCFVEN